MQCLDSSLDGLPVKQYNQPQNKINTQIKRVNRAEENYRKLGKKKDATLEEHITGLITLLEELHKLLKPPHGALVYWENILHQALQQKHAAKVSYSGGNSKILMPC